VLEVLLKQQYHTREIHQHHPKMRKTQAHTLSILHYS